jgi:hypothetical protein
MGLTGPRLSLRQTLDSVATYASDAVGANTVKFKRSGHVAHVRVTDAGQRVCRVSDRRVCRVREVASDACVSVCRVGDRRVCRPYFCCVEKLTASFEDGGYKYLLAGPCGGLLTFLTLLCIL